MVGATSVIRHARIGNGPHKSPWLDGLLARKCPKLAAVALANKTARVAWKLLASGEAYDRAHGASAMPAAA